MYCCYCYNLQTYPCDWFCGPGSHIQSWSELLAPLVNMIKEGSENKPALLILLIFYFFLNHKNLTFELKQLKMGGKSHYEIMHVGHNYW